MKEISRRDFLRWGIFVPLGIGLSACSKPVERLTTSMAVSTDLPKPTSTLKPTEVIDPTETKVRQPTKVPATPTVTNTTTPRPTATERPTATSTATPKPTATERPIAAPTAERKVNAYETIYHGSREVAQASLTIDDGWSSEIVSWMLDTLKENNVQTTFFIPGTMIAGNPELWQRAVNEGHEVCNHTYNHTYLTELFNEGIVGQINGWENAVENALGSDYLKRMKANFPFLRMPGGAGLSNARIMGVVGDMGYYSIAWSIDSYSEVLKLHDLENEEVGPIADEVVNFLVGATGYGDITLVHANQWDGEAFARSVAGIESKGIKLVSISKLLGFT